jgi:hypothetical protein
MVVLKLLPIASLFAESNLSIGHNIDELILIAECSFANEYQDQIIHLLITKEV